MKIRQIIFALAALAAFVGCQQEKEVEVSAVSFGSETVTVSAAGDVVNVPTKANCNWTAASDASWLQVAPASGSASTASINVKVDLNETGADRSGVVTIASVDGLSKADLTVKQGGVMESESDISSAEKFTSFLANAINATDADVFNVIADIDMGGATIEPAASFAGVLEGNGHKIYNYKVVSKQASSAIFLTNKGTIEDLILGSSDGTKYDGTSMVTFDDAVAVTSHVGGVAAVNAGTIKNVKNFAKIVVKNNNPDLAGVGGIAGMTETASLIEECENAGDFQLSGATGAEFYVGGVIAYMNHAEAIVKKSVNSGTVDIPFVNSKASMFGGIVGRANLGATIEECENKGPVSFTQPEAVTSGTYIMIAGIAGALYTGAKAINCVNNADVTSSRMQVSRIGGIVGTLNSRGNVEGCVNNGNVTIDQPGPNDNWQAASGIVGFEEKIADGNVIKGNTNNGNVTVKVENLTPHNNKVAAGGVLGCGVLGLEIEDNINNGTISIINKAAGPAFAGGITGWMRGAPNYMKNNVNKGAVSCVTSDNASAYAGGVIGAISEADMSKAGGTLEGDRNEGTVTCANAAGTGAIAGFNGGTMTGCVAGGTVNGVVLDDNNFGRLAIGTNIGTVVDLKSPSGGTAVIVELKASPTEIKVDADEVSASFDVESNAEWKVACTAEWIKSFTASGKENGKVEISFDPNTSKETAREALFTVSAEGADPVTVKLTQSKVASFEGVISDAKTFGMFLEEAALISETTTVEVTADIDLEGATIEPIASFAGTLDGNGHKIYNYKVASKSADSGLIIENKGTVKNLILGSKDGSTYDGVSEVGYDASVTAPRHVGGLCAINSGTVSSVKQFATVKTPLGNTKLAAFAGIVGTMEAAGTISGCDNYATIDANKDGTIGAETYLAGVVGYVNHADALVENCTNNAPISIKYVNAKASMFAGVVGRANLGAKVNNCHNKAPVSYDEQLASGTSGNYIMIAGVVGALYTGSSMTGCTNTADVTSSHLQVSRIAGIVGTINTSCSVENCTNDGKITLRQAAPNNNWQSAGGIVGFQEKVTTGVPNVIKNNVNNGSVTVEVENVTDSSHANKVSAGGIIGVGVLGLEIEGNTNNGDISATNKAAGICFVGGITGRLVGSGSLTKNNVNKGKVSCATSDNVNAYAGGVAGAFCTTNKADASTGTKSDAVSTGDKNLGAVTGAAALSGSLIGFNFGAVNDGLAGGSVNGTALSSSNAADLAVGSSSKGTVSGVTFAAN